MYNRETPFTVECNDCTWSFQFEEKALNSVPKSSSRHVIIFNSQHKSFFTYYVVNRDEPYALQLSNLPRHVAQFNEYINLTQFARPPRPAYFLNYGPEDVTPNNYYPFLADLSYWARGQLMTRNPFYNYTDVLVIIAFKNGYTVEMVLKMRSHAFILIKVVDDKGRTLDTDIKINNNSGGGRWRRWL